MLNLRFDPYVRSFAALTVVLLPVAGAQELGERDHKAIGELIEDYLGEDPNSEDQIEVKEDLIKALEKIGKKRVEKGEDPMQGALALTADLGEALFLAGGHKKIRGGKITASEFPAGGETIEYAVWVPKDYKHTERTPLLLCVPGMGDTGPMSPSQFLTEYWTDAAVRDGAIIAAMAMPEDTTIWNEVASADGVPGGVHCIMGALREVRTKYAIDADRVFLVGRGEGVGAAMSLGGKFPHLFAGVVGLAGDAGEAMWQNFHNLPTFLQGGGAQATAFEGSVKDEYGNCTLKPEAEPAELWAWMQQNPRQSNPMAVTLRPGKPIPNKAYWIEIPPTDAVEVTIKAEIDRAANTIKVTAVGVESITIYFNDVLVDLDKPVKVVLNGREQEAVIPRSVDEMLALIVRGTSDAGKIYVARRSYDISG